MFTLCKKCEILDTLHGKLLGPFSPTTHIVPAHAHRILGKGNLSGKLSCLLKQLRQLIIDYINPLKKHRSHTNQLM